MILRLSVVILFSIDAVLQYEEPTSEVELMREKLELDRCSKCSWLVKLAEQQYQAVASVNGGTSDAPLTGIALPADLVKKAQRELRLTKQQVQPSPSAFGQEDTFVTLCHHLAETCRLLTGCIAYLTVLLH